jgi:hypothetical protein
VCHISFIRGRREYSFLPIKTLIRVREKDERFDAFAAVTMKKTMKKREKWVVVRDTTAGGNRIYHRF